MLLRVREFGGIIPKLDEKALPPNCAVEAINCDLRGNGIVPLRSITAHRASSPGAGLVYCGGLQQIPTACYKVSSLLSPSYVALSPLVPPYETPTEWVTGTAYEVGDHVYTGEAQYRCVTAHTASALFSTDAAKWSKLTYTVVSNDQLWYVVYLEGSSTSGQGCIDVHCTDGTTLGAVNDQNGLDARSGNLANAVGAWYLRKISLASLVGKSIDHIRLYQNHSSASPLTAYYALALIYNTGTSLRELALLDVDAAQAPINALLSGTVAAAYDEVHSDNSVYAFTFGETYSAGAKRRLTVAHAQMAGQQRCKHVIAQGDLYAPNGLEFAVRGRSNHDSLAFAWNNGAWYVQQGFGQANGGKVASGWVNVPAPLIALSAPTVTGGSASNVTRSYVYTRVSEDGFESAPSPPREHTGKPDGSWDFTNVPTWSGTSNLIQTAANQRHRRRIYRTPQGSSTYKFVGELDADDTSFSDTVTDANLGDELDTNDYESAPALQAVSTWTNGMIGGVLDGTEAAFCVPWRYHAWPYSQRYTLPSTAISCGAHGDRFYVITNGKPVAFSGSDPENLIHYEVENGETCRALKAILDTPHGVMYPGLTGWGLLNSGGYENITRSHINAEDFGNYVNADGVAMFDGQRLIWANQGNPSGYLFLMGAQERALVKWEVPFNVQGLSYYEPAGNKWVAYHDTDLKFGKLFDSAASRLKWTWKSKLHKFPRPAVLKVAQIDSNEWDTLSASMKAREAAYKTGGGGSPYTITITGLTQAEAWCYLKVWAEADKGADKVLVFDDFVVSDRPVRLSRAIKSDCWQFEMRGNIAVSGIALAGSEQELNAE